MEKSVLEDNRSKYWVIKLGRFVEEVCDTNRINGYRIFQEDSVCVVVLYTTDGKFLIERVEPVLVVE